MRTHRNRNTEIPEQKESTQLNHDRPDLRQPGMGVSHQPVSLVSKVEDGAVIQSEARPTVVQLKR